MAGVVVDTSDYEKGIAKLIGKISGTGKKKILGVMDLVAEEILNRSINSPVPRDVGDLERSATTFVDEKKNEVVFGFNKSYAAFQDAPGRSTPYIIRPKRKKVLYVPISQRGKKHRAGNNPKNEGLIRGEDYVLAKEVRIPIKPYGSAIGPNHYFSETIKRNVDFALNAMAKGFARALTDQGGSA